MEKGGAGNKKKLKLRTVMLNPQPKTMEHGCHYMVENLPSVCEAVGSNLSPSQRHERL